MSISKKLITVLVCLAIIILMSSGCGSSNNKDLPSGTDSKNATDEGTSDSTGDNFNSEGLPIVNEVVTKKFMIRKPPHIGDPSKMVTLQEYEKMTNVKVEWDVVSSDGFAERVNLVMASNTMPDAIIKGVPDITKSSADGAIIDLTELIDKYSVGIKKLFEENPAVKAASISPDGKMYSIPSVNTLVPNLTNHRNMWINKKWLDKLNLNAPETTDELINVLKEFRDKDPNGNGENDEIPMVVEYSGGDHFAPIGIIGGSFGIYQNMGYRYLQIIDDKVNLYATSDKYKELLEFMNLMWEEKLLDNAIYTQTADIALSKFNSEISGLFGLSSDDLWNQYADDYIPLPPPRNPAGDPQVIGLNSSYGGASMVITKADKTPEISLRWIDYFFTEEGSMLIGCFAPSLEGISCVKRDDGSYDYTEAMYQDERGISVTVGEACPLPGGGFPYWRNENNSNYIYSDTVKKAVPVYEPYYQKDPAYGYPVFSVEDAEKVNDIRKDLDLYLNECEAKFITGEMSFNQWDEYVKTCEKLGIKELESYFQSAYNKMKQ